jgi:hypothetical protein
MLKGLLAQPREIVALHPAEEHRDIRRAGARLAFRHDGPPETSGRGARAVYQPARLMRKFNGEG